MRKRKPPFELPKNERVRLTQNEMTGVRWCLNLAAELNFAKEHLQRRLAMIPYGRQRMNMAIGALESLFQDMKGTMTENQCNSLANTVRDYSVRLVPNIGVDPRRLAVSEEDFKTLITAAQEKCKYCTEDGRGARKCALYKLLEAYVPLDDYGDDIWCAYASQKWEEKEKC